MANASDTLSAIYHLRKDLADYGLEAIPCGEKHDYLTVTLPLEDHLPIIELCLRFDDGYLWVSTMDLIRPVSPEIARALLVLNDKTPLGKFYLDTASNPEQVAEYAFEIQDTQLSRGILFDHLDLLIENLEAHLTTLLQSKTLTQDHLPRKKLLFN